MNIGNNEILDFEISGIGIMICEDFKWSPWRFISVALYLACREF